MEYRHKAHANGTIKDAMGGTYARDETPIQYRSKLAPYSKGEPVFPTKPTKGKVTLIIG